MRSAARPRRPEGIQVQQWSSPVSRSRTWTYESGPARRPSLPSSSRRCLAVGDNTGSCMETGRDATWESPVRISPIWRRPGRPGGWRRSRDRCCRRRVGEEDQLLAVRRTRLDPAERVDEAGPAERRSPMSRSWRLLPSTSTREITMCPSTGARAPVCSSDGMKSAQTDGGHDLVDIGAIGVGDHQRQVVIGAAPERDLRAVVREPRILVDGRGP